jgi:hypothetical protein
MAINFGDLPHVAADGLEQYGRSHHASQSGIEIVNNWHVKPYGAYPRVMRRLQGFVERENDVWKRTPPARDSLIDNCYCSESVVKFAHPDAMASSPSLAAEEEGQNEIINKLQDHFPLLQSGTAGAVIEAHYRPLITAWKPSTPPAPGDDQPTEIWDWMDPVFLPSQMQLPWPSGMHAAVDGAIIGIEQNTRDVPSEAANPISVSVSDISIKRILVGEVPWQAIEVLANVVNGLEWPVADSPAARGLGMTFKPRTLKFVDADLKNMMDSAGNRWYEITLNFKWIRHVSNRVHDNNGVLAGNGLGQNPQTVTWDHMLLQPAGFITGWYEIFLSETRNVLGINIDGLLPGFALKAGNLHNVGTFTNLFKLNP